MGDLNLKSGLNKLIIAILLLPIHYSAAQVSVTGAIAGNGSYTNLRLAFSALNAAAQTNSDIVIMITGNTTETATATLNGGTWNSVIIKPQGNLTISGNLNTALVNFSGANKVVVDGLNTEGNSLTFVNTSTSASWGTCTMSMTNGASYNIIKNCTLKGSAQNGSMGVVFINAGAAAANHHNSVTACTVMPASEGNYPIVGIMIRGTASQPDTFTNVSNNQISDFFSESIGSTGISAVYSENLSISGNRIFQTGQRNGNTVNSLIVHRGIYIGTSSNSNHTVSGNTIGYADGIGNGKTIYSSVYQMIFRGIDISPGATSTGTISITENKVAGIESSNNYSGTNFLAINVANGPNYEIKRNIIGSLTSNNSIVFNSTLTNRYISGILLTSSGSCNVSDNYIGGISTSGAADITYNINCIQVSGTGSFTISGNTIGSNGLSNSIVSGTAGVTINNTATIYAINVASAGSYATVSNNVIQNITAYSAKNPQIRPIRVAGGASVNITGNSISGISAGGTGSFTGIQNVAAATNAYISSNTIKNIYLDSGNYYGVSNSGNVTGTLTITGNLFGDGSAPSAIISGSGTLNCYFINTSSSVVHNTMNITANDFRTIQAPEGGANYQYFIYNSAQSYNQNISDNIFTNITVNNAKGAALFRNDVILPAGSVQTISNNRNVGPMVKTGAGSFYLYFSAYSSAAPDAVSIHSNNNFSNISMPDSAIMYGWYFNNNGAVVKQISNNTFANWTLGSANHTAFQLNGFGTGSFIRENSITDITSSGSFTALYLGTNGSADDLHVNNNVFSGISSATGNLYAINTVNNSPGILIHDNQVSNLTSTSSSAGSVSPLAVSAGTGTCSLYNNTISGIEHTGVSGSGINGILINGGTTSIAYRNKIYNMSLTGAATSGQMSGISVTGGTNVTLHNNIVGALTAPYASSTLAIIGIRVSASSAATQCNVYNNTVYIDASSTGTNFGTAALYHRASSTASIARLVLKNNILINKSAWAGTGFTTAIWRSSTVYTNYDSSSNNNLLYAGTPAVKNLIVYNSTGGSGNDQTIASFKTRVTPAESNSLSENVTFASIDPSLPAFLHIADGTASLADSNGSAIAIVSTDFDGDIRDGDFPDVGADEFTGATPTLSSISTEEFCSTAAGQPVTITGTNLGLIKYVSFAGASGRLTATIVSQSSTTILITTPAGFVSGSIYLTYGGTHLESDPYIAFGTNSGGVLQGSANVCPGNVNSVLTLGSYTGTIVKWQQSSLPDFSSNVTDIASTGNTLTITQLSQTTFYRVVVNTDCGFTNSTVAALSVLSTTWNGTSWTNGLPDSSKMVIISAPLVLSNDMGACALTISNNASVDVAANTDITVTGSVTVDDGSNLTFAPASNLLQLTDAANTGNIVVQQRSAPLYRLDYTMWSSPVTGLQTLQQFSPNTSPSRFYTYNTLTNTYNSLNATSSVFANGKGYLIRMPNSWTPYNAVNPQPAAWTGSFTGVPNNGTVTVNLNNGGTAETRFNAVGNPYPSAINITDFISANSSAIDGTIWLWRKTNDQNNPVSYSTCTAAGCTRNNGFSGYQDDTVLEKGQGFIVKLKPGSNSLTFTNAMRRGDNNLQFFREAEKNRYWLDITNNNNSFAQLLVAHMPGGTPEYDEGLDGIYFNESPTFLGTAAANKLLSIEARGDFEASNIVPLYFSTDLNGEFTISLSNAEGIFNVSQAIYLKDKDTGTVHNFALGGYKFHSVPGVFKNRFLIAYQASVAKPLAQQKSKSVELSAVNNNGRLFLVLEGDTIHTVMVHDLTGKEMLFKENIESAVFVSEKLDFQHQVVFVKVIGTNGAVYAKKIVF